MIILIGDADRSRSRASKASNSQGRKLSKTDVKLLDKFFKVEAPLSMSAASNLSRS